MSDAGRILGTLSALLGLAACGGDQQSTGSAGDHAVQTAPLGIPKSGSDSGLPRVLVDASRDGGVWWFPQGTPGTPFSGTDYHQGQPLADSLRSLGYVVEELPRPFAITDSLLASYAIVIRAIGFGTYSAREVAAYKGFVERGGKLLLLADHMKYAPPDGIALAFGIDFRGITRGGNSLNTFAEHAITQGLEPLTYLVGSGIVSHPASATIVGWLSRDSYLDLDKDGARGPTEPAAPAALGVMPYGEGRIVFCGDVYPWELVSQPLVRNVLRWFKD